MQEYFDKFRSNLELNQSFQQKIAARHASVRSALENIGADIKETKLIGSLQRRTRIQPRPGDSFDIDILVVLGQFDRWVPLGGITSGQALDYVLGSVQESDRYSAKRPTSDAPTISLNFDDDTKVELVPAYVDNIGQGPQGEPTPPVGRGYWVPKTGGGWQHADYDFDADFVSRMNAVSTGRLVPAIKMLKAARRIHFPLFKSFGLEILAAYVIPAAVGISNQKSNAVSDAQLMRAFFVMAGDLLAGPITVPYSNSPAILLNADDQAATKRLFSAIVSHIEETERLTSQQATADAWRLLFGDTFPSRL